MSATRSYLCLSCRLKPSTGQVLSTARRAFQTTTKTQDASPSQQDTSSPRPAKAFRRQKPLSAAQKELKQSLEPYTERQATLLKARYTPDQIAAIEAGEKAIPSDQMVREGRFRTDKLRLDYIDDFATVRPLVDQVPDSMKDASGNPKPALLPPKPSKAEKKAQEEEEDPHMKRLAQQTGLTVEQIRKLRVKNLVRHRVVNQTRMGKIQSMYFLSIAGNQDGMVGIGEGKAVEEDDGRRKAMMNAIRNMKPIPRYEERTIFGEVEGKVGASIVQLSSRPPGFGNRCQHLIFELARAAGISDLAARTPRSRNKMNVVKAAFQALTNQRLPEDVARARGKKMVDVRSVYYGGSVL